MKRTITMLAFLVTTFITWMTLSLLVYSFSTDVSITFKEASTQYGIGFIMIVFGWIPGIMVAVDVDEITESKVS